MEDQHMDVRRAAVNSLAHLVDKGNAVAIEQVALRLEHAEWEVKCSAVDAFAQVAEKGDAAAIAAIVRRLEHPDGRVRLAAVAAYTKLAAWDAAGERFAVEGGAAVAVLAARVDDAFADVRVAVLHAINTFASKGDE